MEIALFCKEAEDIKYRKYDGYTRYFPFPTVKMAMSKGSNALKLVGAYPQFVLQEVTMATMVAISG